MGNCLNLAILASIAAISPSECSSTDQSMATSGGGFHTTDDPSLPLASTENPRLYDESGNQIMIFSDCSSSRNGQCDGSDTTTSSPLSSLYTMGPVLGHGQSSVTRLCTSKSSPGSAFACKSIPKPSGINVTNDDDIMHDIMREVRIMCRLSGSMDSSISGPGTGLASPNPCSTRPSSDSYESGMRISASTSDPCGIETIPNYNNKSSCLIARLHQVIEDTSFVHLIIDLCRGGELFDRILRKKRYQEPQAAHIIKSLLEAVRFFHSIGVMHRDLKPENILFVDESESSPIKVVDFGLALEFSPGQKFSNVAGSTYYIAPEVLKGEYSEEIDMWSVGVILYILLSGVPPFWGTTRYTILKAIQEGHLDFSSEPWDNISSSAKDLISGMLCSDVKSRLTPEQALRHPWVLYHMNDAQRVARGICVDDNYSPKSLYRDTTFNDNNGIGSVEIVSPTFGSSPKSELHEILSALVSGQMSAKSLETSTNIRPITTGWSCTLLTITTHEHTLLVEVGQKKYIVVHDKKRKRIGWKMLATPHPQRHATRRDSTRSKFC